jgi:hypothetical protein
MRGWALRASSARTSHETNGGSAGGYGVPRSRLRGPHHDHHAPKLRRRALDRERLRGSIRSRTRCKGIPRCCRSDLLASQCGFHPVCNVITAAQVNATIGVGEAILAMLHELRSRSKEAKKGLAFGKDQDPRGSEGETYDRSPLLPTQA